MKLTEFVVSKAILPNMKVTTKEDAIRTMVASLTKSGSLNAEDEEAVVAAILKREELGSTGIGNGCLLYTSPSPRDLSTSRMPSSA